MYEEIEVFCTEVYWGRVMHFFCGGGGGWWV